jgi:hypothetical protein
MEESAVTRFTEVNTSLLETNGRITSVQGQVTGVETSVCAIQAKSTDVQGDISTLETGEWTLGITVTGCVADFIGGEYRYLMIKV